MAAESLERLPFDYYGRYRLAADVVRAIAGPRPQRVLDVGGGPGALGAFLDGHDVVASDLRVPSHWHVPASRLVVADGALLPFTDAAFDVVVTLDTLEHVRPERRRHVLAEALRVSRGWTLVVCPCATPGVAEADAALLAYVRRRFGEEFETVEVLTEHLSYGHPDPDDVEAQLRETGAEVVRFPSGRLDRWLPMMLLFFSLMSLGRDDPVERVQAWYNRLYYRDDLRAPSYRQAFLARLPGAVGPPLGDVLAGLLPTEPSEQPDSGALEALGVGLTDSLRDTVEEQAARIRELEAELAAARQRTERLTERAEGAEADARDLAAFRDRILSHPVVRARARLKHLIARRAARTEGGEGRPTPPAGD